MSQNEQQIAEHTRILDTGELVTLADPQGGQLHVYSGHPHGGYRVLTIVARSNGSLPHTAQTRLGPTNLHGWLADDVRDGWQAYDPDTE